MGTIRDPYKKKQLSYQRDRIINAVYPHAYRKSAPWRKASLHRWARSKDRELLGVMVRRQDMEEETVFASERSAPFNYRKLQVRAVPLGDVVPEKRQRRICRMGWNLHSCFYCVNAKGSLDGPYLYINRERVGRFLESLAEGESPYSWKIAQELEQKLEDPDPWLGLVFETEPEWERRFRAWLDRLSKKYG